MNCPRSTPLPIFLPPCKELRRSIDLLNFSLNFSLVPGVSDSTQPSAPTLANSTAAHSTSYLVCQPALKLVLGIVDDQQRPTAFRRGIAVVARGSPHLGAEVWKCGSSRCGDMLHTCSWQAAARNYACGMAPHLCCTFPPTHTLLLPPSIHKSITAK